MIKNLLFVAVLVLFGTGVLSADPVQPQWLLNVDGTLGEELAPSIYANEAFVGGDLDAEWMPDQYLGFNLGYDYLSVGKIPVVGADNDIALSLQLLPLSFGITTLTFQAGGAYNLTSNEINTKYMAFVGPGIRVAVAPYLAFDTGIQYQATAPLKNFRQGIELMFGISVPLDAPFAVFGSSSGTSAPEATQQQTEATPVPTAMAAPEATPVPAPASLLTYVVQKGDYLWKIAGDPNVFGDSRMWPLLLETNCDKIQDQDFLKPGLILYYKSSYTTAEIAAARKREWFTPAFEPPQLLRGNPLP